MHDLRHYAVESVLGSEKGFYGLIATGWEIEETTGKGARGPLPHEAIAIEHLVGMLDADTTNGSASSAEELNQYAAAFAMQQNHTAPRALREQDLVEIHKMEAALHAEWIALPDDATMRLSFPLTGNHDALPGL